MGGLWKPILGGCNITISDPFCSKLFCSTTAIRERYVEDCYADDTINSARNCPLSTKSSRTPWWYGWEENFTTVCKSSACFVIHLDFSPIPWASDQLGQQFCRNNSEHRTWIFLWILYKASLFWEKAGGSVWWVSQAGWISWHMRNQKNSLWANSPDIAGTLTFPSGWIWDRRQLTNMCNRRSGRYQDSGKFYDRTHLCLRLSSSYAQPWCKTDARSEAGLHVSGRNRSC